MNARELLRQRLTHLQIAAPARDVSHVVSTLGALQAQDYAGALWAIGLRMRAGTLLDVQHAVTERSIVRTWPMRGTLHIVAAADVYWLLELLAPRVVAANAKRHRDLELDAATFIKVEKVLTKALRGGKQCTREQLKVVLARAKLPMEGQRLYHCLWFLAQHKVLCCGAPSGKQGTYTLLSEWVPEPKRTRSREDALVELARRYFSGHGPATQQDLMRWAGITVVESKLAIAGASAQLSQEKVAGVAYWFSASAPQLTAASRGMFLLPGFDEYMLGYKDRSPFVAAVHASKVVPGGNGVFKATVVDDGQVIGTWKATSTRLAVRVVVSPFGSLSQAQRKRLSLAVQHYAGFLEKTGEWSESR